MPYLTLNGRPVLRCEITMPSTGAWFARLAVDDNGAPEGTVTIAAADGRATWRGTAYRSGVARDMWLALVVGGGGGLADDLTPKFYRGATVGLVLREALQAAGERLSPASDQGILGTALEAWTRASGSLSTCIRMVCRATGATWRVLSDGTVWVGRETWPAMSLAHEEIRVDPHAGRLEIASEVPALIPGVMLSGRRVTRVEHKIDSDSIRTVAYFETDGVPGDDQMAGLTANIQNQISHLDYFAQYVARVDAQNSDGTLELQPEDQRLPGLSGVPIHYGIPGVSAKVFSGARVLVGFEAGNPARPIATVWESASLIELSFDGGTAAVARVGDATTGHTHSFTFVTPAQGMTYVGATGNATDTIAQGAPRVKA